MQIRKLVASAIIVAGTAACMPQEAALHAAASEAQLPQWDLSDAVIFPTSRGLQHAEDGVVLSDGRLLVGDSQHGLVTLDADGNKAPFGNFAGAGFVTRPAEGWSNPNGIAFEPDGLHVLIADIVEGKIFRANSHSGAVELIYDHEFGVNTAVADSTGAIWFTQSTRNASGADAEGRMYAAVDRPLGDGAVYRLVRGEDGEWTAREAVGGFDFANGIALDEARGQIYVAESLGGAIHVIPVDFDSGSVRPGARTIAVFSPDNVEMDSDGNLWVAQPFANQIVVINPDSGDVRPVFTPTPDITRDMETEITRRLVAGEPLLPLLGPDLHGPMPGALTGVILSPNRGPVYVSNLGDALVRLER